MRLVMTRLLRCAALLAVSAVAPAASRADVLYDQPFADGAGGAASQFDPNQYGSYATVYDNFTLGQASSVTGVSWTGLYFNPGTQAPISGFTVDIYANDGGVPGALLESNSIAGNANETFLDSAGGFPTYSYSSSISPFAAAAGTEYWIAIVATVGFPPQWGWNIGTGGDGAAYQDFFGTGSPLTSDVAFGLTGTVTAVPEPSSLALGGLGVALAAGWKLRKRRRAAAAG